MLTKLEMTQSITNKIKSYAERQQKLAFGKGTDKAWKFYKVEMEKFRVFINSEIEKWNKENNCSYEIDRLYTFSKNEWEYWLNRNC